MFDPWLEQNEKLGKKLTTRIDIKLGIDHKAGGISFKAVALDLTGQRSKRETR